MTDRSASGSIVLVGNPNVGKSVIFGRLTGRYVVVANYPGTTVEIARGKLADGTPVIDTPGTNTLTGGTEDERVTKDVLVTDPPQAVVQVADARNLPRALMLTLELAELGVPLVLVLNMSDEARASGVRVDTELLSQRLGIDVVETVATKGHGITRLAHAIRSARTPAVPPPSADIFERWEAAQALLDGVVGDSKRRGLRWSRRLSLASTHPVWGWPVLLVVLAAVYMFVGRFGAGVLVNYVENTVFGEWINPFVTNVADAVIPIALIRDLLVGEYGVFTMALTYGLAIVLPIVTTFFIAFSILEDSGYLPRLAVMLDRTFRAMGLNGKAVLPMVLGLGCDTMATMTTRILESRKHRIQVTLLLALGVPCSAQLGVILGMTASLSPVAIGIWAGVVIATTLAVGFVAAKLLPGDGGDFILELPPMRRPQLGNIVVKTLARLEWYLKEVLPLFVAGTLLLFVLDRTGALSAIERAASPIIVDFLGLPAKATSAFLIGFLRRDYGAAGLFAMSGEMTAEQLVVSLVAITLFIPCIANLMMIVKEFGGKVAAGVAGVVFPLAFAVGGLLNLIFSVFRVRL